MQQRLVAVAQDHSLGVGVAPDFFAELRGLLDPPAHDPSREGDAARQPPRHPVDIHQHLYNTGTTLQANAIG